MKNNLLLQLFAVSVLATQPVFAADAQKAPDLGEIAKTASGVVRHTNQYDAEKSCEEQKLRLPTARELAQLSQSLGAKGIRETTHAGVPTTDDAVRAEVSQNAGEGYFPVFGLSSAKRRVVDFYFNSTGYKRPAGDLGKFLYWSASALPVDSGNSYVLNSATGAFDTKSSSQVLDISATRCLK